MTNRHLDLRDEGTEKTAYAVSSRAAVLSFAVLSIFGLLAAAIIPELSGGSSDEREIMSGRPMAVLLSCTIDSISVKDRIFEDLTVPEAYAVVMGSENENITELDGVVSSYLDFLLGDVPYRLSVRTGSGWSTDAKHVLDQYGGDVKPSVLTRMEVSVGTDGGEPRTMVFELEVKE